VGAPGYQDDVAPLLFTRGGGGGYEIEGRSCIAAGL
jgi:hypothetical protein